MKNIIFLTYLDLWSMGNNKGAPSFYKTIEAYLKDGWNVTLISPKYNVGITPKINKLCKIDFIPLFYPLVRIKRISFIGRLLHGIQGDYCLYRLGKKVLKQYNNHSCIYAYEVNGVKAGSRLAKKYNLPFVTRFQGTVLSSVKNNWFNRLKRYPHFQALETEADIVIMTDDGTEGDKVLKTLNNTSKTIKLWRNGVDIDNSEDKNYLEIEKLKKEMGIKNDDKVLITISRLVSWKRVDRAIKALSTVVKQKKNVKLVIVGDGTERQKLVKLTEDLKLGSHVIFAGAVNQSDVRNYLDLADIFLSLYDLSNIGNPLLEAMARGKPIITLNVGNTSSLIKNNVNGVILELDQLNEIPKYILELINNKEYAVRLGNNARNYAKENFWSWEERMNAEINIVNELYESWELT